MEAKQECTRVDHSYMNLSIHTILCRFIMISVYYNNTVKGLQTTMVYTCFPSFWACQFNTVHVLVHIVCTIYTPTHTQYNYTHGTYHFLNLSVVLVQLANPLLLELEELRELGLEFGNNVYLREGECCIS